MTRAERRKLERKSKKAVRTPSHFEITEKIKDSLMSDELIEKVICLHNTYPGSMEEMIKHVKWNMNLFISRGYSVIDSYEACKQERVVRCSRDGDLSLIGFERALFKLIIECFTEWRQEVVFYELTKSISITTKAA